MIYYLLFFLLGVFSVVAAGAKDRTRLFYEVLSFFIVVSFQGLRWDRGTDWDSYYSMFAYPSDPKWYYEYGWYWLNEIVRTYTGSYSIFLLLECSLIALLKIRFARYVGLNNRTVILLGCFAGIFPVRFTLASVIVLNSYQFLIEKKFPYFLLLVILASTIHMAAILIIPFYFVPRKEYPTALFLVLYLISVMISFLPSSVLSWLYVINDALDIGRADSDIQFKIDGYMSGGISEYSVRSVTSIILSFISGTVFIILFGYFRKKMFVKRNWRESSILNGDYDRKKTLYLTLFNLYVFGLCFNRIVAFTIPYLSRIGILASAGFTYLILLGVEQLYPKKVKLAYFVYVLYLFSTFYMSLNGMYHNLYIPYKTIFDYNIPLINIR